MKLHPFRAMRPTPTTAQAIVCPPYDVVSTEEARDLAAGNPHSLLHVTRSEIDLPEDVDAYDARVYERGADAWRALVAEGLVVPDDADAIWLYRQRHGDRVQTGFVGCADVADYRDGRIKKHELTRRVKEDDRTRHIATVGIQSGPVFLACKASHALAKVQARLTAGPPEISVVTAHDGVRHEVWPVRGADDLASVADALAPLDAFYIADGHHRAASAARVADLWRDRAQGDAPAPWERFLVVVFPDDQLEILAYNRVVRDLGGKDVASFLDAVSARFEISEPGASPRPTGRHVIAMYVDGAWRHLRPHAPLVNDDDAVRSLDVAILQEHLLKPILHIEDPRADERIDFVGGSRGLDVLARRVDAQGDGCAFSMWPTSLTELFRVADAGAIMPPKSTWFEPKLASGLFVHQLVDPTAE